MSKRIRTEENQLSQLKSNEVYEVAEVCIAAPMDGYPGQPDCLWGIPLLIEGKPGIAKTARVKRIAKDLSVDVVPIFAGQHPPEDFSGVLIPDGKGGANQICTISSIRKLIEKGEGILFFDEINGASPATQGAIMSVVHERRIGDDVLPPDIRIIAAQNPTEISAGGIPLTAPLANRFVHAVDPGPSSDEWTAWLIGASKTGYTASLSTYQKAIASDWPDVYPGTQGLFAGFIQKNQILLHKLPSPSDPAASKAWPSHRTWDFAGRLYTTAKIQGRSEDLIDILVECAVGPGAASAFQEYRRNANLPDPLDVLNKKWTPHKQRLDIIFAAYTSMVNYVTQRPSREEKHKLAVKAWAALEVLFEENLADILVPAVDGLVNNSLGRSSGDPDLIRASNKVLVRTSQAGLLTYLEEKPQ